MTYNVSSGMLNTTIPYHTCRTLLLWPHPDHFEIAEFLVKFSPGGNIRGGGDACRGFYRVLAAAQPRIHAACNCGFQRFDIACKPLRAVETRRVRGLNYVT